MSPRYQRLAAQLCADIERWQTLRAKFEEALIASCSVPALFRASAVGKLLHDFYTGLEEIFSRIARELDEGLPVGERWHRDLLGTMSLEIKGVRPSVIPADLVAWLEPYLRFRHVFRNVYGYELDWQRIQELASEASAVMDATLRALEEFLRYLERLAADM